MSPKGIGYSGKGMSEKRKMKLKEKSKKVAKKVAKKGILGELKKKKK